MDCKSSEKVEEDSGMTLFGSGVQLERRAVYHVEFKG